MATGNTGILVEMGDQLASKLASDTEQYTTNYSKHSHTSRINL